MTSSTSPGQRDPAMFRVFNEVGIIEQLARNWLERRLPKGMRLSHFTLLNHCVLRGDGQTFAELASAFQVTRPAITNTVKRLLTRKLVEVRADPDDGRTKRLFLTALGFEARTEAVALVQTGSELFKGKVDDEVFNSILPALVEIRQVLDAERDTSRQTQRQPKQGEPEAT